MFFGSHVITHVLNYFKVFVRYNFAILNFASENYAIMIVKGFSPAAIASESKKADIHEVKFRASKIRK